MAASIYWIPGPVGGRLGVMARPRSGDWLNDEVASWQSDGLNTVVSLLEPAEVRELGLADEESLCRAKGINFVSFPIKDRGVPTSSRETEALVQRPAADVAAGSAVAIHCRAGIGRSALLAACILKHQGVPESDAFPRISRARGVTCPDTEAQVEWFVKFPGGGGNAL